MRRTLDGVPSSRSPEGADGLPYVPLCLPAAGATRGGTRPPDGRIPPRRERQPVNPAVMEVNCQLFWLMPEQLLTTPPPGQGRSRLTAQ